MSDEDPRPTTTRRVALKALGVGAFTVTAGCLSGDDGEETNSTTNESRSPTRRSESESTTVSEPTASSEPTTGAATTQEQSIITGSPAATAISTTATIKTPAPRPTTTAEPTGTQTVSTTRTPGRTTSETATPEPTMTPTAATTPAATESASVGGWTEKAPLPVVGSDAGGGVLDGKLYFFGGIETAVELDAVARTFAYDPAAGTDGSWERLPDLPHALWGLCGVATDDALYSFGGAPQNSPYSGNPPSDAIFRYRPGEGWTDLTETKGVRCPYPNWVMDGLYNPADGLIYCVGGGTGDWEAESASDHGFEGRVPGTFDESRLWTFDPDTERVADPDLARMPEAKRWPTAALFSVDGTQYLHALGGLLGTTGPTDSNFRYNFDTGEFEHAQPIPRPGTYATHSNPVIDNRAYLTHGMFWEGDSTIERYKLLAHRYNPETDSFETDLPDPTHQRGGATSGVIDETLYVVGGHVKRFEQNGLHDCFAYNEAYTPARDG